MSKREADVIERLRSGDATALERRLLDAASHEAPSRELSARMAGAIGITLPDSGTSIGMGKSGPTAPQVTVASSSVVPWVAGVLVAALATGALVAGRPGRARPAASAARSAAAPGEIVSQAVAPAAPSSAPAIDSAPAVDTDSSASAPPPALPRVRNQTAVTELAAQVALVDAARLALASGRAGRALTIVRDYQMDYPTGTFRPEVSAIKIEALLNLGRKAEARALAERFVKVYGPGPLTDRVSRLAGLASP